MISRGKSKWLTGISLGVPLGMALMTALAGVLPLFVALPGGGERCTKCHDLHGGIRLEDIKGDGWIRLTGDVTRETWIETTGLFHTHQIDGLPGVSLRDLLTEHGCEEFRSVVLVSCDGGHVSVNAEDLTESARLLPHLGAARFADERLHSSAWLRRISEVCVVADSPAIEINGHRTTFGTLLAGDRAAVVTESAQTALDSVSNGRTYHHVASRLVTGVPLLRLLDPTCGRVRVKGGSDSVAFRTDEILDAVIARDPHHGDIMLALPRSSRADWFMGVTAIECEQRRKREFGPCGSISPALRTPARIPGDAGISSQ